MDRSPPPRSEPASGVEPVSGCSGEEAVVSWSVRGGTLEVELLGTEGDSTSPQVIEAAASAVRRVAARHEGASLQLAANHPPDRWRPLPEAVADALGLEPTRLLLQLRRPLPVDSADPLRSDAPSVAVRPIADGDDEAWIRVNNRAFSSHPDQGRETLETLATRRAEDWYDPAGFLVLDDPDRPGELAGFCWTKVHSAQAQDPDLGEIYVIGLDPTLHGRGLGLALVLAGLDHLAGHGIGTANLYVEADNAPAIRLYERLGFAVHERRRVSA